ncbi:MAG: protein-export membrane protein SecF [Candidatus Zambryskibacteria bacterium RIFCSPLOWO2_01_FULL_39_39]|uniref:Protein-export membrane protein SecF n=1 Tax=Candidatus Zambryskibacteria bacterium RIFCSPLOWO2_01_FULL_39_39 TaxID=1802758 RepID=A0A1G2TZ62_9BACT|nr:MAG: Protein translocase subunit SecF [Parcubacteria group bacterium GW2011_GWA1_38_7]OHA87523.1 MAG: protein-export membrane protein SecF [Candidatus Zambryskibacteria bacterium RIFCSPHIGHO2_01_FULL_39_63]OHA95051.1 MAG: protein-export membrane protein SecF [Candidatus Zambryskibacteria bacterium RIFCSPHIGHO2_02_FULL_39_19]OHA98171.1 MAG: protein-export membrane protein SecF [Candidatus Zambryskibacteria bacterium RIFCSPHIGHO2_12_FULL_39_21]OHB02463.1 MAG: protein-export membrane protein Se
MLIVKHRKIFYFLSIILLAVSVFSIFFWGLKPGIDFTGGSLLSISYEGGLPEVKALEESLKDKGFGEVLIRKAGKDGFIIRMKEVTQEEKNQVMEAFSFGGSHSPLEKTFSNVGPILGKEAIYKSWISIVLVLLAIVFFIAFAFRKVSKPISSWIYGVVTVLALLHDVLVPTGIFALLGHFYGFEVDTLFVTALLVILGFSVHDTIVVFDRVRENLHKNEEHREGKNFETIVGESINETFVRSINTSLTTLLAILVLYIFGPEAIKNFSLALLIGITVGTYSSIFIGSTLLVTIDNWKNRDLT